MAAIRWMNLSQVPWNDGDVLADSFHSGWRPLSQIYHLSSYFWIKIDRTRGKKSTVIDDFYSHLWHFRFEYSLTMVYIPMELLRTSSDQNALMRTMWWLNFTQHISDFLELLLCMRIEVSFVCVFTTMKWIKMNDKLWNQTHDLYQSRFNAIKPIWDIHLEIWMNKNDMFSLAFVTLTNKLTVGIT